MPCYGIYKGRKQLDGQQGGRREVPQKVLRAAALGGQYLKEVRGFMTGTRRLQGTGTLTAKAPGKGDLPLPPQGLTQEPRTLIPQIRTVLLSSLCKPSSRHSVGVNTGKRDWWGATGRWRGKGNHNRNTLFEKKNLSSVKEKRGKVVYKWYSFGLTISRPDFFFV